MPELLSIHGRCPRCSQLLTVPAGQLQGLFRCARCQYRVLGATLMEEARLAPPRLAASGLPVVRPFEESSDDQETRLHMPAAAEEEVETALPAQLVDAAGNSIPPRVVAPPLRRFGGPGDPDDQQTRLHVAGSFEPPRRTPRPQREEATVRGVPSAPRLSRFGAEPDDADDQATRLHMGDVMEGPYHPGPSRGQTTRGMPAPPLPAPPPAPIARFDAASSNGDDERTRFAASVPPLPPAPAAAPIARFDAQTDDSDDQHTRFATSVAPPPPAPRAAPLSRFDAQTDDSDDQNTRLQVPIAYEEAGAPGVAGGMPGPGFAGLPGANRGPDLHAPVAARLSLPTGEPEFGSSGGFGLAALKLSRWIDDWVRERHAVLLLTLAALCSIIAPIFDVLLGNPRQGATVIAANLALFFLWALGYAWLGKLVNDADVWDYRTAFSRMGAGIRLALADLQGFGSRPLPLRWRVTAELSAVLGLGGLGLASALTLTHLVFGWPQGTGLLFLWRLLAASGVVLSVIAAREAASVPAGLSPAPDVTAPAVTHFPAVLDLSLPLAAPADQSATALHQVLELLSQWQPREWPDRDSYIAALERHFLERSGWGKVERARRLGAERGEGLAHLIVDDALLLEVVRGFDSDIAERLALRMRRLAKVWRGRPALIVVFDASRAELLSGRGTPQLEALHQAYPMLAVRMPSARISLA